VSSYDAVLLVGFGGPEQPEDVMPFLEIVTRGRNVPPERLLEVAEHYHHFDGRSPINDHNRALMAALQKELHEHGPRLPVYWGNRNWHPFLADTMAQMKNDGVQKALAFVTSAFSSYSGCRQYRENIADAQSKVGDVHGAQHSDVDGSWIEVRSAVARGYEGSGGCFTPAEFPAGLSEPERPSAGAVAGA
jgi:ferrochelatase